jgi:erythromycin esterase-like protein
MVTDRLEELVAEHAHAFRGSPSDLDPLIERAGQAGFALLGEATHGTHEFYRLRAQITRRLIEERGFNAVLVEADWPDAYRVNRFVQVTGTDTDARAALDDFERFPRWMWRNHDIVELIDWMRHRNADYARRDRVGFYGIDLYSLHRSMNAVVEYLSGRDEPAAERARQRYACFDHFGQDAQAYGYGASGPGAPNCEEEVVDQLVELERERARLAQDGLMAEDEFFFAEQNARVARNAEQYYRQMYRGQTSSWNLRDQHMAETAASLADHLRRMGRQPRVVVWAHNSHLGDARATSMSARGEVNLGQLLRQRFEADVLNVGFTTHTGWVTAAAQWGKHADYQEVRPALPESIEGLLHRAEPDYFLLDPSAHDGLKEALSQPRLQRAIGVIYRPLTERASHYFSARIAEQFDWIIHLDTTSALAPLDPSTLWVEAHAEPDLPETYPFGL